MIKIKCIGIIFVFLLLVYLPAGAQTADAETPANQGVCEGLTEGTPGVYGLCVGFCETQNCEAAFDPATGAVTFGENCKSSAPGLLSSYNERMPAGDPEMPCITAILIDG
ncbi:MAG: hypothetical protein GY850_33535 [bacterium]|nr:hypothetical protein [bacterium]